MSGLHRSSETEKNVVTGPVSQPSLVHLKDRGGLVSPFPSAISVCQEIEKLVQRMLKMSGDSAKGRRVGKGYCNISARTRER